MPHDHDPRPATNAAPGRGPTNGAPPTVTPAFMEMLSQGGADAAAKVMDAVGKGQNPPVAAVAQLMQLMGIPLPGGIDVGALTNGGGSSKPRQDTRPDVDDDQGMRRPRGLVPSPRKAPAQPQPVQRQKFAEALNEIGERLANVFYGKLPSNCDLHISMIGGEFVKEIRISNGQEEIVLSRSESTHDRLGDSTVFVIRKAIDKLDELEAEEEEEEGDDLD